MPTLMDTITTYFNRAKVAAGLGVQLYTRPEYTAMLPDWRVLSHAYCGSGGFKDGTYLVAHPREWLDYGSPNPSRPSPKLIARRQLARYENWAALLVDTKLGALARTQPTRQVKDTASGAPHPIRAWWNNVDGAGCAIDDWMLSNWIVAAVLGHVVVVMDRPAGPRPETKADEQPPYLVSYSPLDVPDWATGSGRVAHLTGLRVLEEIPRPSITDPIPEVGQCRTRILTADDWRLLEGATLIDRGEHRIGRVPASFLYARRSPLSAFLSQSVLGNPKLYLDDFNLISEMRELLRQQTFGLLNVPLGEDGKVSVQQAREMMGAEIGTNNVLFTPKDAKYVQPSGENLKAYQEERRQLQRAIFRLANVAWESDSRDAEAEGSMKLKRQDMSDTLAAYADELEATEYDVARLWFQFTYGAERWQEEWDRAGVTIRYPDEFNVEPFEVILEQAQAAIALEMPDEFLRELKKRLVPQFLPDAPDSVIAAINEALQKQETVITKARARLASSLARVNAAA